ncbi:cystathionine beta-lyase [Bordetella avium]|uniref:Cystathionine beta-lyase n=2 Tax=Bordetella avium TaxID=521 RepID=METC_BORAV|nr:cystathionine beta-lyase [Bordetella avium]Q07703.3 RecName: Full=Cystathionine beta-lyase; Short=CBL; AltName: Full=Beta-cystathionase; AltName: Full=Cysteine lyase; AltName: Full=Cysteine-S-conjugate beta-lyase; AltName: Full=Osteotoxin [Bordetella avium]AAA22978.1 cystathionine beta-lyase [Bordetella avium]AZY50683.1 cystathionine beta-lyase [Bordetella avium]AZY54081.1 cystathionine beta-lyase [Bordetella avium]RIQ15148.1 cystathionine beta-lyase [Bordetella avium]RIQ20055.1 cystathion
MSDTSAKHIDTLLQHLGSAPFNPDTGAAPVNLPSVRASTVRFQSLAKLEDAQRRKAAGERASTYGRMGMDTHAALEQVFAELEGGTHCYLASSGLAGISMVFLSLLSAGEHALVADCAYGPVHELHEAVLSRLGIDVTFFDAKADLASLVRPTTRLIFAEAPGSLLFEMLDMPALARFAKQHDLILATDNTWGSGYIYRPLTLGAQVSVIAGTKYVGGHSDLMLGAVVTNDEAIAKRLNRTQYALGYSVSADDAWLALRGVRTMPVRMAQHARHALEVCEFLQNRPEVVRLYHPAWPADPGHALWQRDCSGSNGMLAVQLGLSPQAARDFVNALTLFGIGFSWGGFESLVQLVTPGELARHQYWQGGSDALVRLHIGLESPADLIADLAQALDRAA